MATDGQELHTGNGWVRLFHPRGPLVTLPVLDVTPAGSLAAVAAFVDAGWLTTAPGLEEGEQKEDIGYVCRIDHEKDGDITPTVLLYSANQSFTWSFLRKYFNSKEEVVAFEHACRVRFDALPVYPGNDHPQRGAGAKTDKYIVQLHKPASLVWKPNPRYKDAPEGKDTRSLAEKRKRDFVRWADMAPAAAAEPPKDQPAQATPAPTDGGHNATITQQEAKELTAAMEVNRVSWEAFAHEYQIQRLGQLPAIHKSAAYMAIRTRLRGTKDKKPEPAQA